MIKKILPIIIISLLLIPTAYSIELDLSSIDTTRKDSETIEEYKARIREQKQELLAEYKNRMRQEKQTLIDQNKDLMMVHKDEITQEAKSRVMEQKEEKLALFCEKVEEKVDVKILRFEENKNDHIAKYDIITERISEIILQLVDKGYDVTELEADLATFEDMVLEYTQAYADFIELLESSKEYACGESEGAYRNTLKAAKEQLLVTKELRRELTKYYRKDIRNDIKDLREQARSLNYSMEK
ncbi:hypothetical protein ACFL0C_01550 [Patescibacteria group bacterium]